MSQAPRHSKPFTNSSPSGRAGAAVVGLRGVDAGGLAERAQQVVGAPQPAGDVVADEHLVAPDRRGAEEVVEGRERLQVAGVTPITAAAWRMPSGVHQP